MITEGLFDFFVHMLQLITSMLPTDPAPGWVRDGTGYLETLWGFGDGLGAWVPWGLVGTVFAAVILCIGVGFGIKIVRILASFFTAGGGSAA